MVHLYISSALDTGAQPTELQSSLIRDQPITLTQWSEADAGATRWCDTPDRAGAAPRQWAHFSCSGQTSEGGAESKRQCALADELLSRSPSSWPCAVWVCAYTLTNTHTHCTCWSFIITDNQVSSAYQPGSGTWYLLLSPALSNWIWTARGYQMDKLYIYICI